MNKRWTQIHLLPAVHANHLQSSKGEVSTITYLSPMPKLDEHRKYIGLIPQPPRSNPSNCLNWTKTSPTTAPENIKTFCSDPSNGSWETAPLGALLPQLLALQVQLLQVRLIDQPLHGSDFATDQVPGGRRARPEGFLARVLRAVLGARIVLMEGGKAFRFLSHHDLGTVQS